MPNTNVTYQQIEKLEGIMNYLNWKFSIRMLLTLDGVWGCVEGTDTDAARDQRALARICLSLQPKLFQFVRAAKTSKEAWKSLSDTFEDKGLYRKVLLLRQLHRMEYVNYTSMSEYIEAVMSCVAQLADIGKTIEDGETAEILLSGLPEQYDVIVSGLETASLSNNLTTEIVRTRLLQEDHRRNGSCIKDSSAYVAKNNMRKPGKKLTCTYCKKAGHTEGRCFKKKREEKNSKTEEHTLLASAFSACCSKEFVLDSGATTHMCADSDLVRDTTQNKCSIYMANGEQLSSERLGKVNLTSCISLDKVLLVPSLSNNLMSVSQVTDKGYVVVFDKDLCKIYDQCKVIGNQVLTANRNNGLYKVKVQCCHASYVGHSISLSSRKGTVSANAAGCVPMSVWHKRLGHLNQKGMFVLGGGNQCVGVVFQNDNNVPGSCVACVTGKMHVSSFPSASGTRAAEPLNLIHSDVCGPMQVSSWGGARYLLTFTDDNTRKTFGYLMKNKSEVSTHFITFKNMVEKQTGLHIKILRTDNGTEYCNSNLSNFLTKEGIIHQTTVRFCPEQNGVAERVNRTIFEKARAMLQESCLCDRFWGEAVITAIYLKNRSPTSALADRIPECEWTGSNIDLSHLRIFGCEAYSHIPDQRRRKLDAKARQFIFVGYGETCKGYRLADPNNPQKVIYSRSVVFREDKFIEQGPLKAVKSSDNFIIPNQRNCILNIDNKSNNDNLSQNNNLNIEICTNYNNANNYNLSTDDNLNENSILHDKSSDAEKSADTLNRNLSVSDVSITPPAWSPLSDQYHTTEDISDGVGGDEDCVPLGAESSLPAGPSRGGVPMASEGNFDDVSNSRPVRSTRGNIPYKLKDFDLSSLLAAASSLDEPPTFYDAVNSPEKDEWHEAMKGEYNSMIRNNVWELVDRPECRNIVKNKWVFKKKFDASGKFIKYKARLVACGYSQKEGIDYADTFSPVVRHSTLRILFSISNQLDLLIDHIDVTTAFLNGELDEVIYMEQPAGFKSNDNNVCLLKKSIYGLKQASRVWNIKIHNVLSDSGFIQSKCEPCVYVKRTENEYVMLALYVDDFYVFHNGCIDKLLALLRQHFEIRHLGELKNCLGINITKKKGITILDQSDYIKRLLDKYNMADCKPVSTPLPTNCKLDVSDGNCLNDNIYQYRQLLGSLMYLSVCTRPDISYACSQLSQYSTCFDVNHWRTAKRVLRYLAGTLNYGLHFVKGSDYDIKAYADADWANDLSDRKSYTGFVIKIGENVINWEARKQRCTALSSTEAEYIAISDVCKDICFVMNFLSEIISKSFSITVYNDNQSAQKLLLVKEYSHKRTKHIDLRYHFVKNLIQEKQMNVKYLPTDQMIADVLTKQLCREKHCGFVKDLRLKCVS